MQDLDTSARLKAQGSDGWVCGEGAAWGGGVWEHCRSWTVYQLAFSVYKPLQKTV